jgi:hypothetical protein
MSGSAITYARIELQKWNPQNSLDGLCRRIPSCQPACVCDEITKQPFRLVSLHPFQVTGTHAYDRERGLSGA